MKLSKTEIKIDKVVSDFNSANEHHHISWQKGDDGWYSLRVTKESDGFNDPVVDFQECWLVEDAYQAALDITKKYTL